MNPWKIQAQYSADFDKIKCLDVSLIRGQTIQIPAYWWYSIKLEKDTSIACFRYRTYMNNAAISPHIFMYGLQLQNVKRDSVKKHDISSLNKKMATLAETTDSPPTTDNSNTTDSTPISNLPMDSN